jgi:nucleoside-diphosphate-sugar epimerase
LRAVARSTGLEIVIVRPPLVYGPHVKGNFLRLLHWAYRGFPLPLGGVSHRRSLIGVENLARVLLACACDPRAAQETFLVSDNEDLSTPELLRRTAAVLGRPVRLVNLPPSLLSLGARLSGQQNVLRRLCGPLLIDSRKIREVLNWIPPNSVHDQLKGTADWYLAQYHAPQPTRRRAFQ